METTQVTTVAISLIVSTGLFACKSDTPPAQAVPVTVTTMTIPAAVTAPLQPAPVTVPAATSAATAAIPSASSTKIPVVAPSATGAATGISPEKEGLISSPGSREGAHVGEMCGGFAGILCKPGLQCVMAGKMHPDKSGICQKK